MIPATAHFIWYGKELPWVYTLAIRSAARRGGFNRVVLHHRDDLSHSPGWAELCRLPLFEARLLDEEALLERAWGRELAEVSGGLQSYAAKSNLVRAALLFAEGGVYLDLDTVTVRSLEDLREASAVFLGLERLVYPHWVRRSRNPLVLLNAGLKDAVRFLFRLLPYGYRVFSRLEPWYPSAANNAVLGAEPGHPFMARLLEGMVQASESRRLVPYSLGTYLLQQTLEKYQGADVRTYAPEYFFPLGPQISRHWFRCGNSRPLHEILTPKTRVVHWYASEISQGLLRRIDADYVRAHAPRQLFSRLALPFLDS